MERFLLPELPLEICAWIREQVGTAGAAGVVVGMSGGIDSSVVAVLAHLATNGSTLGVMLPCQSSPESERHAQLVADRFGLRTARFDLAAHFESLSLCLPEGDEVAVGNLKARLRMAVLYYYANIGNYLVAGTSNRSELSTGYFTKHGDGAADILPIAALLKSEVRQLASDLGIPREIIDKAPTADLWPGQTDESELGLSYEELDEAIRALDMGAMPTDGTLAHVNDLMARSRHKRTRPPWFRKKPIVRVEDIAPE